MTFAVPGSADLGGERFQNQSFIPAEPRIFNHIFSHKPTEEEVDYALAAVDPPGAWRKGFWSASRSAWADKPQPLGPNEENTLSRRYAAQKHLVPSALQRRRQLLPDFEEHARARAKRLQRARAAERSRQGVLQRAGGSDSSGSSSSTSSTDTDPE